MKFKIFHYLLVSSLLLMCVFQIPAEFIYIGNFEDEINDASPFGWIPHTDDDIKENGWIVKGGKIVQTIINDDQTKGGVRVLFKDNILDFTKANRPEAISFYLDVYPLDYKKGSGDVWFGMGFMADSSNPVSNSIIVALRKNNEENKSGLHIFAGKNGWISQKNNFDFQIMKWHRIRVYAENRASENSLLVKAKVWLISNPEPEEWLATAEIPFKAIDLSSKGVFIGAYATLGNKKLKGKIRGNPRCAFDNFIIYRGDASEITYNLYSSSEKEMEPMLTLSGEYESMKLYEFAHKISSSNFNYSGFDRLMFLEMLFLREIHQWEESCLRANQLMSFFPESPYSARMGGKDGRTEDQAAIDFADATTPMQSGEYEKSYNLFKQFLENYPNNWRHDIAQYRMIFSFYEMSRQNPQLHPRVIAEINNLLENNKESIYVDDAVTLLISIYIREGNKLEARKLLDFAKAHYSNSTIKRELDLLWIDAYLHPAVYDKEEVAQNRDLDYCHDLALQFIDEGSAERAFKYVTYFIKYVSAKEGGDEIGGALENLKDYSLKKSKRMNEWVTWAEAEYYWDQKKWDKSVEVYRLLMESAPETNIRKRCVEKISQHMAATGASFSEIKEFQDKYNKEEEK